MHNNGPVFEVTDIHVDIETLGTRPDSVVLSIGAAFRHPQTKELITYHQAIEPSQPDRHIDADTLAWWMEPAQEAAGAALRGADKLPLGVTLHQFTQWLEEHVPERECRVVWGNGSDFDNAILTHAYRTHEQAVPWDFWNNQSLRTLKLVESRLCARLKRNTASRVRPGMAHSAVEDAKAQLLWAEAMLANIVRIARD